MMSPAKLPWAASLVRGCLAAAVIVQMAHGADASVHREYLDGPWGQVHVRIAGRPEDPAIVLVHQFIWSSEQFRRAQPELAARGVRSIAVDVPGYGMSDGPAAPVTVAQYAEVLASVLSRAGIASASFLGVNEGGAIVCAFADAHPDKVKSLIFEGPPVYDTVARERYFAQPRLYAEARTDGSHLPAIWRGVAGADTTRSGPEVSQSMLMSVLSAGTRGWFAQEAAYRYDFAQTVGQLKVPVMLLTYTGQPLHQAALDLAGSMPRFTLETLEWTGIAATVGTPEAWAERVAAYVKAHR
jgi:pimeloyl-ACP methyl ester carboxylesterase